MQQIKYIAIEESALYKLNRKRDLAALLQIPADNLKNLRSDANYEEWPKKQAGKDDRIIEEPNLELGRTLGKLHLILTKVETPSYLLSGKKKIKPRDNAELHSDKKYMINVDIKKFFRSTKREFVYQTFNKTFKQSNDVASILADLTTYKGHIPTGTATSQLIAFWAYKKTFDRINTLCKQNKITMSVWVDDITFSRDTPFPQNWIKSITKIFSEVELELKLDKTKIFFPKQFKTVTGTAISPDGKLVIKNQKRKEIIDFIKDKKIEALNLKPLRQVMGKLTAQRQIEPNFYNGVYLRVRNRLRILEKSASKAKTKKKPYGQR